MSIDDEISRYKHDEEIYLHFIKQFEELEKTKDTTSEKCQKLFESFRSKLQEIPSALSGGAPQSPADMVVFLKQGLNERLGQLFQTLIELHADPQDPQVLRKLTPWLRLGLVLDLIRQKSPLDIIKNGLEKVNITDPSDKRKIIEEVIEHMPYSAVEIMQALEPLDLDEKSRFELGKIYLKKIKPYGLMLDTKVKPYFLGVKEPAHLWELMKIAIQGDSDWYQKLKEEQFFGLTDKKQFLELVETLFKHSSFGYPILDWNDYPKQFQDENTAYQLNRLIAIYFPSQSLTYLSKHDFKEDQRWELLMLVLPKTPKEELLWIFKDYKIQTVDKLLEFFKLVIQTPDYPLEALKWSLDLRDGDLELCSRLLLEILRRHQQEPYQDDILKDLPRQNEAISLRSWGDLSPSMRMQLAEFVNREIPTFFPQLMKEFLGNQQLEEGESFKLIQFFCEKQPSKFDYMQLPNTIRDVKEVEQLLMFFAKAGMKYFAQPFLKEYIRKNGLDLKAIFDLTIRSMKILKTTVESWTLFKSEYGKGSVEYEIYLDTITRYAPEDLFFEIKSLEIEEEQIRFELLKKVFSVEQPRDFSKYIDEFKIETPKMVDELFRLVCSNFIEEKVKRGFPRELLTRLVDKVVLKATNYNERCRYYQWLNQFSIPNNYEQIMAKCPRFVEAVMRLYPPSQQKKAQDMLAELYFNSSTQEALLKSEKELPEHLLATFLLLQNLKKHLGFSVKINIDALLSGLKAGKYSNFRFMQMIHAFIELLQKNLRPEVIKNFLYLVLEAPQQRDRERAPDYQKRLEEFRHNQRVLLNAIPILIEFRFDLFTETINAEDLLEAWDSISKKMLGLSQDQIPRFKELFVDSKRCHGGLLFYAMKLQTLSGPDKALIMPLLQTFTKSVLNGDLMNVRYDIENNRHLATVFEKNSDLLTTWMTPVPSFSIDASGAVQETPQCTIAKLLRQAVEAGHLGKDQKSRYPILCSLQDKEWSDFSEIEKKINQLDPEKHTLEKLCLELLNPQLGTTDLKAKLEEIAFHVPEETGFKNDVHDFIKRVSSTTSELAWSVYETDHWEDLFLCGTEVFNSCQHIKYRNPEYSKCLFSYLLDGKNRVVVVKNDEGKIIARVILRILWDRVQNKPVLFMERIYQNFSNDSLSQGLMRLCKEKAKAMNLPLLGSERDYVSPYLSPFGSSVESLGGPVPYEYVDAIGGIIQGGGVQRDGKYTIPASIIKVLYDPSSDVKK